MAGTTGLGLPAFVVVDLRAFAALPDGAMMKMAFVVASTRSTSLVKTNVSLAR
jgi:hypothetical protein